jgi:hypothetical protein
MTSEHKPERQHSSRFTRPQSRPEFRPQSCRQGRAGTNFAGGIEQARSSMPSLCHLQGSHNSQVGISALAGAHGGADLRDAPPAPVRPLVTAPHGASRASKQQHIVTCHTSFFPFANMLANDNIVGENMHSNIGPFMQASRKWIL